MQVSPPTSSGEFEYKHSLLSFFVTAAMGLKPLHYQKQQLRIPDFVFHNNEHACPQHLFAYWSVPQTDLFPSVLISSNRCDCVVGVDTSESVVEQAKCKWVAILCWYLYAPSLKRGSQKVVDVIINFSAGGPEGASIPPRQLLMTGMVLTPVPVLIMKCNVIKMLYHDITWILGGQFGSGVEVVWCSCNPLFRAQPHPRQTLA